MMVQLDDQWRRPIVPKGEFRSAMNTCIHSVQLQVFWNVFVVSHPVPDIRFFWTLKVQKYTLALWKYFAISHLRPGRNNKQSCEACNELFIGRRRHLSRFHPSDVSQIPPSPLSLAGELFIAAASGFFIVPVLRHLLYALGAMPASRSNIVSRLRGGHHVRRSWLTHRYTNPSRYISTSCSRHQLCHLSSANSTIASYSCSNTSPDR